MKTNIGRKIVNQASEETKRKVRDIADTMVIQEKFKRLKGLLMLSDKMTTKQKREAERLNDEIEAYLESDKLFINHKKKLNMSYLKKQMNFSEESKNMSTIFNISEAKANEIVNGIEKVRSNIWKTEGSYGSRELIRDCVNSANIETQEEANFLLFSIGQLNCYLATQKNNPNLDALMAAIAEAKMGE
jgi:hypothetical protein